MDTKTKQPRVLVTGMPRSGTSLVASVILEAFAKGEGAKRLAGIESQKFQRFHQRTLMGTGVQAEAGFAKWGWTESEQVDTSRFRELEDQAKRLIAAHGRSPNWWGWEDPRSLLFLDYWDQWVENPLYVLVYRYPWDVADSLQRMEEEIFLRNPEYAYRIWEFYNHRLREFYIANADRCLLVSANALPANLNKFLSLMGERLGLKPLRTRLEPILHKHALKTIDGEDPLIDLMAAAWPSGVKLLSDLDALADLSSEKLWKARPHKSRLLRPETAKNKKVNLSVVTPSYNQGILLIEAVASVERNAPPNTEYIIVNDGSTDPRTVEILKMLKGFGYFVIDQENAGLTESRNRGIAMAHGRYILPLDDDNRIRDHLQEAIDILDSNPEVGVVYGDRNDFGLRNRIVSLPDFDLTELLKGNYIDACAVFRKQVWIECGGYDREMSPIEDWELWIHAAELGWEFRRIPKVTFDYRVRPSSLITLVNTPELLAQYWKTARTKHAALYCEVSVAEAAMLRREMEEREEKLRDREEAVGAVEEEIRATKRAVQARDDTIRVYEEIIREHDVTIAALTQKLEDAAASSSVVSDRLSAKTEELDSIRRSAAWRMLNRYGRFKYRYLLPAYRAFGMAPSLQVAGNHDTVVETAPAVIKEELPLESNACDVVCFPIIDWDFRFQRPQQLMARFAESGHRVFYIRQQFHASGHPYKLKEKRKNVYEVSLKGPERNVYEGHLDDRARDFLFNALNTLRREQMLGATISFVQLPFWWPLVDRARDQFAWPVVYDCMDHHAGFSTNKQVMLDQERDLMESADLVVVSSTFLAEQVGRHKPSSLLLRNACDYDHFAGAGRATNKRPLIGYYGAIADWFDSDLVADLAEKHPEWDFVLVGSTFSADISRLSKLPNVSLPGEKSYSEIPEWLGKFDVAIIPFKRTPLTEATNPVKVYEMLAAGKPLVSVPIPEVASMAPLVRLGSTAEEFAKEIAAALEEENAELADARRSFAGEHTWAKRYETLGPTVREVFPRASIIVVTYNNLELNRLCLESIYARTEWPNFEVIVVDNASVDGTPDYLREAELQFPNLQVVLNSSNLGFAAANNIGLQKATGEFLVLLNNDTVVTRGWLSNLIRHLNRDPTIGLIGPVTNRIGNEAKVDVDYEDLADMPEWAARFVRQHDDQVFPIPMLAMFCVAMKREAFEEVGFLDEQFGIGMFEDDDYAHRMRINGRRLVCAADVFIHHFGEAAFNKLKADGRYDALFAENRRRYEEKWDMEWVPHKYAPTGFEPTAPITQPEVYQEEER